MLSEDAQRTPRGRGWEGRSRLGDGTSKAAHQATSELEASGLLAKTHRSWKRLEPARLPTKARWSWKLLELARLPVQRSPCAGRGRRPPLACDSDPAPRRRTDSKARARLGLFDAPGTHLGGRAAEGAVERCQDPHSSRRPRRPPMCTSGRRGSGSIEMGASDARLRGLGFDLENPELSAGNGFPNTLSA
jgi:hypothetical protein